MTVDIASLPGNGSFFICYYTFVDLYRDTEQHNKDRGSCFQCCHVVSSTSFSGPPDLHPDITGRYGEDSGLHAQPMDSSLIVQGA